MDERLRRLERAAATGDEDAQVALLAAQVRSGTFPRWRAGLAAYLGHPRALAALGEAAPVPPEPVGVLTAGGHALEVRDGLTSGRTWCGVKATKPERDTSRTAVPTCRRCLGSPRWRDHVRSSISRKWTETIIDSFGLQAGRMVAIGAVEAVLSWSEHQARRVPERLRSPWARAITSWRTGIDTSGRYDRERMDLAREELELLRGALERAESPGDPAEEAQRIVRIVSGATMLGWEELLAELRDRVGPRALDITPAAVAD